LGSLREDSEREELAGADLAVHDLLGVIDARGQVQRDESSSDEEGRGHERPPPAGARAPADEDPPRGRGRTRD